MRDLLDIDDYPDNDMNMNMNNCQCIDNLPLAYSYVPYQVYEQPFDMKRAFESGTVFPSLDKPYGVYGNEFRMRGGQGK